MSDTTSDADKIRNKRLAKLAGQASSRPSLEESGSPQVDGSTQPVPVADPPSNPKSLAAEAPRPRINIISSSTSSAATRPISHDGHSSTNDTEPVVSSIASHEKAPPTPRPDPRGLEIWEDKVLRAIFRISLEPDVSQDGQGNRLHDLPGVRADLTEEKAPMRLNVSVLEQAILEAASNLPDGEPLHYLLSCWKRLTRTVRSTKFTGPEDPKQLILKEARRLCMSYCIFAATMPDMFGLEPATVNPFVSCLLAEPDSDRGVCHDFLTEAVSRFEDDDSVREVLLDAVDQLSQRLAALTMNDDYKPYVLALRNIVRYPALANGVAKLARFLPPDTTADLIETKTFLGPFFRISPISSGVMANYFSSPRTRDTGYIVNSQKSLRLTLQTHQSDLLDVVNHILRASKESRERILDWFALVVNSNHKRRAIQVDGRSVSTDGFMINVNVCLDQLCEPFMDATFSKVDRIDVDYLRRKPRLDVREETKLNADQHASDEFYGREADGTSNFISEVFFLTLAGHHYGIEAAVTKLDSIEKDLKHLEKQLERFEAERSKWLNSPQFASFENARKKCEGAIDQGLQFKFSLQGVLFDELMQARSLQFMRYVSVWLLRLVASDHAYPKNLPNLPLPDEQPEVFACLPEYFLEDIVGVFKFIFTNVPHVITSTQSDELVTLCITFLRSSEYIKNPYLKSGLVGILFRGIWPSYTNHRGVLGNLLNGLPFATEHLLHALMKFYIEVENTGAHTQFYDKFNIRYEIFQVIKCIWSNPVYRENLSTESKVNVDFFVRFVNLLLNDVTFVLDESLTAFGKIHGLQRELEDSALQAEERGEKEAALAAAEQQAKNYMQLTNETVAMLKLFTEALAASFTMPEIVQRLADMLDYNLEAMVGPKSSTLKVRQPEKYNFDPKHLLSELVDVYLNLRGRQSFIEAVARDGRSYKPVNLEKATIILKKWSLKSPEEITAWNALAEKFRQAKELDDQAEEDLGEIPDEFLDPLMFTLMEDPVILPASRVSIDRSTIRSHLLSDPNDPFNRAPLKIEDVVDDTDLKSRIQQFKTERKSAKVAEIKAMAEADMDQMDMEG